MTPPPLWPQESLFAAPGNPVRVGEGGSCSSVVGSKIDWGEKLPAITALTALGNVLAFPGLVQLVQNMRAQFPPESSRVVSRLLDALPSSGGPTGITAELAAEIVVTLSEVSRNLDTDINDEELKSTLRELLSIVQFGVANHQRLKPDALRSRLLALLSAISIATPKSEDAQTKSRWKAATKIVAIAIGAVTFTGDVVEKTEKMIKNSAEIISQIDHLEQVSTKLIEDQRGEKKAQHSRRDS